MGVNFIGTLITGLLSFAFIIGIYVLQGIFLTKFNKLINGKGTPLAWIPICNIYLLGKLSINKIVGWILVVCAVITAKYTVTINGVQTVYTILPKNITSFITSLYSATILILFIYSIIKYNDIKKGKNTFNKEKVCETSNQENN